MAAKPKTLQEARTAIVQAANRHLLRRHSRRRFGFHVRLLNQRQVQWAVFVCRQNGLVSPDVLDLAGFNSERRS